MKNLRLFFPGDRVEIRNLSEILATLDTTGTLQGLPFMPEMAPFCGHKFTVNRRIEQTCVRTCGMRQIDGSVFLEDLRCDGSAHGGCEMGCLLIWKEAWLMPIRPEGSPQKFTFGSHGSNIQSLVRDTESHPRKLNNSNVIDSSEKLTLNHLNSIALHTKKNDHLFFCQATELRASSRPIPVWKPRRWYMGLRFRNLRPVEFIRLFLLPFWFKIRKLLLGLENIQPIGHLTKTPDQALELWPGDLVEVKQWDEIAATLDKHGRNRGLQFTSLMTQFCGHRFKVKHRVTRIIMEESGEMKELPNTVILEGVTCGGEDVLGGCPRDAFHLWREIWLKRVNI